MFGFWVAECALSFFEIDGAGVPVHFLGFDFGGVEVLWTELAVLISLVLFFEGQVHLGGEPK